MRKLITVLVIIVILLVIFLVLGPFFIVQEGEQAVVTRFGEIIRTERDAGLKYKTPIIDIVVTYPKRILSWDGDPRRVPTKENQFIWIDTSARWRIIDPELFYASVTTLEAAYSRLDDIIESSVRTIVAQNLLQEAVRNSNIINDVEIDPEISLTGDLDSGQLLTNGSTDEALSGFFQEGLEELADLITTVEEQQRIGKGRAKLSIEILQSTATVVPDFGIEMIDIVIRQIRYSDDLTESVYDRMVSERNRIAQAYRSYGEGRKQEILGRLEREKNSILSEAFALAEELRGNADALAAATYSDAYGQNTDFFRFWRAIESYRLTLPSLNKTLTTDLEYFDYLYNEQGR